MVSSRLITRNEYSLAQREQLASKVCPDEDIPHVLLATCNRTEAYWGEGEIPCSIATHLFRVASGLESSLVGERAIQGQIKQAYASASRRYKLSPSINRLFQSAMHVGKRVRTETQIAEGAVSHSQVTADILRSCRIDLRDRIVAIIGVNKLTEDIIKFLSARGAVRIYLANRNYERARSLASSYGGTAMSLDRKSELLAIADVLISATSAPHSIIHAADFPERRSERIILFDLAFPRDIDPDVAGLKGITLYNLEDIEAFARRNITNRRNEIDKAEQIISEELHKLMLWQKHKNEMSKL